MALLQQYEGKESKNKCIVLDNQYISLHPQQGLFKKNEHNFLFEKYMLWDYIMLLDKGV